MKNKRGGNLRDNFAAMAWAIKKFFGYYPVLAPLAMFCILFSAIVAAVPNFFIVQRVLHAAEHWMESGDWAAARGEILPNIYLLIGVYVLSICSQTLETQLMAVMTQGFLDKMRREIFNGMQDLPIRFFDSNKTGDIMSYFTNDIDTMRQLVSQSLPSLIRSGAVVLAVFAVMVYSSVWMTLVLLLGVAAMFFVAKTVGGGSAKYFMQQQKAVAAMEGMAQESMNGQKVIKVFCHEQQSIRDFDAANEELYQVSYRANAYASMLGPIISNIGNVLYVSLALVGGILILSGPLPEQGAPVYRQRQPALPADQLHRHGRRRRAADPVAGQAAARGGRRLCDAGQRRGKPGRHADGDDGAQRALGLAPSASGRRQRDLYAAARRRAADGCGLCL